MVCVEATVTAKGQITIPKVVRENLNLVRGSKILFVGSDEGFVLKPMSKNPVKDLFKLRDSSRKFSKKEIEYLMKEEKRVWSKL